jgi:integrase/recombinase XerD
MWNELLVKFEEYMQMRRFSSRTVETYRSESRRFLSWLVEKGIEKISRVDKERVKEYQNFLFYLKRGDKGLSYVTQSLKLSAVKCFFRFLVKENYLLCDPAKDIELPKFPKRLPRDTLSVKEAQALMVAPDSNTPTGTRDRAILELLYSTGMRNTELRCLKLSDVDSRRGEVRISFGKGRKTRIVPIGEVAAHFLALYLDNARSHLVRRVDEELLFVSWRGRKLSKGSLTEVVHRYAVKAKIAKKVTCHTLRHSCATHMLRGKADLRYIQEMLGHGSLSTTQIYTKVELSDLKRVHRECHPRNRL